MVLNIGIIGYGGFGRFLHESWSMLDEVEVRAVADQIPSRKPEGDVVFHTDWRDLIKDGELDLVSIATPPSSHADMACAAMEAGKHVLIEKPMATTLEDARRIIRTRDKTSKTVSVDYMLRFNPIVEAITSLAGDKVLGELLRVDVENYAQDDGLPPDHWFWNPGVSGGIMIEHGVHFIDLVNSLTTQKPVQVTGVSHNRNEKQEDKVAATVVYDTGLIATHYHTFSRPGFFEDTSMRFAFHLAQIDVEGWIPLHGKLTALVNNRSIKEIKKLPGFSLTDSQPTPQETANSGGIDYPVEEMISGAFDIGKPKPLVYADCLRSMMLDVVESIEDPAHTPKVTAEDGLTSLEIACKATSQARQQKRN
jgi:predicted dehydrogenase